MPGAKNAEFERAINPPWLSIKPIRLGELPTPLGEADCYVLVEENTGPLMRIDLYGNNHSAFRDVLIWKEFVIIGWGDDVYFVRIENGEARTVNLGCYFGYLYPTDQFLLIASGERLFLFDDKARMQWMSDELGLDGVIVQEIDGEFISGEGEWDPPGDWRPFRVKVVSGKAD
jgi:hypothetical protein